MLHLYARTLTRTLALTLTLTKAMKEAGREARREAALSTTRGSPSRVGSALLEALTLIRTLDLDPILTLIL